MPSFQPGQGFQHPHPVRISGVAILGISPNDEYAGVVRPGRRVAHGEIINHGVWPGEKASELSAPGTQRERGCNKRSLRVTL